jgi:hypothetical protein
MVEVEKKRAEAIDDSMNVHIDLETGVTSLILDEKDEEFT